MFVLCLFVCLFVFVCLFACLFVCVFVCLFVCVVCLFLAVPVMAESHCLTNTGTDAPCTVSADLPVGETHAYKDLSYTMTSGVRTGACFTSETIAK